MIKNMTRGLLKVVDKKTIKKHGFESISHSETRCAYFDRQIYNGNDVVLNDGTIIQKGDVVGEVHLNNLVMSQMKEMSLGQLYRMIDNEMLHMCIEIDGKYGDIKAVYGRSQLYAILKRMGFEVHPVQSRLMHTFLKVWESLYKWSFSPSKNNKFKIRDVKEVWISRNKMVERSERYQGV